MAEKRKKGGGWGLFLLFWTMLLLMLGFLACVFFYKYAAIYEETRPEKAMDALMASMSEDDWHAALAPGAGEASEYEDAQTLFEGFFDSSVRGKQLSYRRDMSRSDASRTTFTVYAGPARLGEVSFVPSDDKLSFGFGRSEWLLESITGTPVTQNLAAITVRPSVPLLELTPLEARMEARIRMVRYELSPLYGDIVVTDGEGNEIAPSGPVENGLVSYVIHPTQTYSFQVEAPEGVEVTVGGAVLGEEEIAARERNMFRKLDAYLADDGGYDTLLYAADGLYTVPDIHASYNGTELSPVMGENGKVYFFYPPPR